MSFARFPASSSTKGLASVVMGNLNATEMEAIVQLHAFAQQLRDTRSISYCILTLIFLEIIFTLDKEMVYIWRRPWSLFKVFFIQCRYLSMIPALLVIIPPAPSNAYCVFFDWYIGLIDITLTLLPSSGLLAIRLDRLYTSKLMRRTLITLVLVESVSQIGIPLSVLPKSSLTYTTDVGNGICSGTISEHMWLSKSLVMVPYLVLICIYIVIASRAFIRHCREKALLSSMWAVRRNIAPLYILFIRDGVICYIINLLGVLCGFLMLTISSRTSQLGLAAPVVIAGMTSMSCCRLALLLQGDPGHATGIYELDTNEVHVEMMKIEDHTSSICTSP